MNKKNKVKTNKVNTNKVNTKKLEYKKGRLKKLIIPKKNKTFMDSDDERRYNDIHTLKNEELYIHFENHESPRIKHFEKTYYI